MQVGVACVRPCTTSKYDHADAQTLFPLLAHLKYKNGRETGATGATQHPSTRRGGPVTRAQNGSGRMGSGQWQ